MDVTPSVPTTLRPLGVGELLDRAVTLTVRHFWPLAAIYVGFSVVLEALSIAGGGDRVKIMTALTQALQHQAAGQPAGDVFKTLEQYQGGGQWNVALIACFVLLMPLTLAALTSAAAAFSLGGATSLGAAYAVAVRRWGPLVLMNLLYFVCGLAAYAIVVIAVVLVVLLVVVTGAALKGLGIALAVVFGLAGTILGIAAAVVIGLAYQVSLCTCVLENAGPWSALAAGMRRVFAGIGLRRSLIVGLAYFAILLGVTIVSGIAQGVLLGLLHSVWLDGILSVMLSVAAGSFSTVFLVLFYFDLRVREEGLDLQAAARALPPDPSPAL